MTYPKVLLLLLVLLCGRIAFSQERTITGKITDEASKGPVAGATVKVKGLNTAVSSDAEGAFAIKAPSGTVILVISSIGYATKEVTAGPSAGQLSITLGTDSRQLGEVVVTALGITRQSKSLVYATQSVKPSQLTEVRDPNNVLNSLQGKVANAVITQGSGGLGSGARIVLRGNKSVQGDNNALIVVDGVPLNNGTFSAATNDFGSVQSSDGASNINPDDIESMTVLRGASAAALYGSQGGNGAIIITTKKGKKGETTVSVNSGVGMEKTFALPDFQNTYGQGSGGVLPDSSQKGASWGPKMTGQSYIDYLYKANKLSPQPDNVKDFFRTGMSLNNSISFATGGEKAQTYLSYTNNYGTGIIRNNDLNRHIFNWRISNQISKKLSTDAKITYVTQVIKGRPRTGEENSPVFDAYEMPRSMSTQDARNYQFFDSYTIANPTNWPSTNNSIYQNPYWMIYNSAINETRNRIIGFMSLRYQLTPWLSIRGSGNLDRTADRMEEKYQQGTLLWNTNAGGSYKVTDLTRTDKWFDLILEGNNQLSEDLKLNYHVGTIYQDRLYEQNTEGSNGLNVANKFNLNFSTNPQTTSTGSEIQTHSVFGQATLGWKDILFLDASVRTDWNSTVLAPYHFTYPSVGVSAILSDLIKDLPAAMSFLKVSANYAQVGNGGQFGVRNASFTFFPGAGNGGIGRGTTLPLPNLKPELVKSYEFGVESRFVNDRIGFSLNYYKSNSTNELLTIPLPVGTGYANKYINAGNIENHGLELVVNGTPVKHKNFSWDVQLNLSLNRNKVIKLSDELKAADLAGGDQRSALPRVQEGGSFGDLYAHTWLKNDKGQYLVNANGTPYTSYISGDPIAFIGNFNPKEVLGFTNTFQYGRFNMRVLLDGRIGGIIESGTEMNLAFSGITKGTERFREGGLNLGGVTTGGAANTTPITAQQFWTTVSGQRYGVGQFFAYSATNFRVRELSFGYDIPVGGFHLIKSLRFSAVARNLFWIYRGSSTLSIPGLGKRKMWMDPDMSNGNGNFQGTEYGAMPSTRTLGFNLKATF
ncbi:SusC/RagA family TonB-linked outer membrane protein [Flavitalea sp. BT771]|uniref:SusC/RagA family TonB-linked outer membrane protein n=1 Tax=Flavitalea sp. BT771 TaxID=3063329 RepID=UPI0026E25AFA|nr:SusC/RagA family TonB-linked outer membrane protein [Flavitalea sp. BT771]MDO6435405.1 SusC/RagA family TonB-linked outer membrane protein [Flavitalea sp. BT771]MDV6224235.1 SusC/RagA family TonB-linked outer membrane protein [Flavitalea sp. BT771]